MGMKLMTCALWKCSCSRLRIQVLPLSAALACLHLHQLDMHH